MAKKKTADIELDATVENAVDTTEESVELEKVETPVTVIPDHIKSTLQCFNNLEELYVNDKGGVFTKDTEPAIRGNAVLYKNPYFNN